MFMSIIISKVRKELEILDFYKDGSLEVLKILDDMCLLKLETEEFSYILKYSENGAFIKNIDSLNMLKKANIETGIIKCTERLIIFNNYYDSPFYRAVKKEDFKNEDFACALANWYNVVHGIEIGYCDKILNAFSITNVKYIMRKYNLENSEYFMYVLNNFKNIEIKLKRILPSIVCKDVLIEDMVVSCDLKTIVVLAVEKFDVGYKFFDFESVLENFDKGMQECFKNNYKFYNEDEVVIFKAIGNLLKLCICVENKDLSSDFIKKIDFSNNMNFLEWTKNLVEWY